MTPADMARLHATAFADTRPWSEAELTTLITATGAILVTDDTGFALGRVAAGEAEVLTIAVDPTARRQGHGAALLSQLEEQARAHGADAIFLEVAANNTAARALYDRAGYCQVGLRAGYYKNATATPVDATVLKKQLAPR